MLQLSQADGALQERPDTECAIGSIRPLLQAASWKGFLSWCHREAGFNKHLKYTPGLEAYPNILCSLMCSPVRTKDFHRGTKSPNHQGSKPAPSCTKLKENLKLTKDKVQPWCVIKWKDHTHCNSNKFWGRRRQHSTALQHSFR